jgi:hypothetical protein
VIGHSQQEYKITRKARPRMTIRDAARGLEYAINETIEGETMTPRMVVLDYLQRMRPDPQDGGTRRHPPQDLVPGVDHPPLAFDLGSFCGESLHGLTESAEPAIITGFSLFSQRAFTWTFWCVGPVPTQ